MPWALSLSLPNSSSVQLTTGSQARTARARCTVSSAPAANKSISRPTGRRAITRLCCAAPTPAPAPVEWLLHALATCLMAGVGTIAAARGAKLNEVKATIEGDIDLRGTLGLSKEVRNGYQGIKVSFEIDGDATPNSSNRS